MVGARWRPRTARCRQGCSRTWARQHSPFSLSTMPVQAISWPFIGCRCISHLVGLVMFFISCFSFDLGICILVWRWRSSICAELPFRLRECSFRDALLRPLLRESSSRIVLQAHKRPFRFAADELLMPLNDRLTHVSNALKARSPGLLSVLLSKWLMSPLVSYSVMLLASPSSFVAPLIPPLVFHPIDSRVRQMQATPAPLNEVVFPGGLFDAFIRERFYIRSLEPQVMHLILRHAVGRAGFVPRTTSRLCADSTAADDWLRIHELVHIFSSPPSSIFCNARLTPAAAG